MSGEDGIDWALIRAAVRRLEDDIARAAGQLGATAGHLDRLADGQGQWFDAGTGMARFQAELRQTQEHLSDLDHLLDGYLPGRRTAPLVRLGPGGDYRRTWP